MHSERGAEAFGFKSSRSGQRSRPQRRFGLSVLCGLVLFAVDLLIFAVVYLLLRRNWLGAPFVFYRTSADMVVRAQFLGLDWFLVPTALCLVYFLVRGHYSQRKVIWDDTKDIIVIGLVAGLIDLATMSLVPRPLQALLIPAGWVITILGVALGRVAGKRLLNRLRLWQLPTAIVGTGANAMQTLETLWGEPLLGYDPVLMVAIDDDVPADRQSAPGADAPALPVVRQHSKLIDGGEPPIAHWVIAVEDHQTEVVDELLIALSRRGASVHVVPTLRRVPLYGMKIDHIFGREPMMLRVRFNLDRWPLRIAKRALDLCGAILLLVLLSPLLAYIAWRIRREDRGPVLFVQARVGRNQESFDFYKFRTMKVDAEAVLERWKTDDPELHAEYVASNFKLRNDPRVTAFGRFLRRHSLDELPQLLNVVRGEMSLVGPRPMLAREMDDYGPGIVYYERVRPGITGLWQVSGRSDTTFASRASFDEWYVRNWSFWYDLVIILKTFRSISSGRGSY